MSIRAPDHVHHLADGIRVLETHLAKGFCPYVLVLVRLMVSRLEDRHLFGD